MQSTVIAVDLAKSVFQIAVSRRPGKVAEVHRLTRARFLRFFAERKPAVVVLEACGSAHYWAREIQALGHRVLLLPPHQVRAYVTRNKTDLADAKALLEAHRNTDIHAVPVKSVNQQAIAALHRLRSSWMTDRLARINLVRGILRELGLSVPAGTRRLVAQTLALVDDPAANIPPALGASIAEACQEIRDLEQRAHDVEKRLEALADQLPVAQRLQSIPGVGLLSATALVAAVGDVQRFPTGRHFASFLGLTPRERSSGLRRHLGAISKRGSTYLRSLLVNGARGTLAQANRRKQAPDRLRRWALQVQALRGHNRAAVALANKLARIVWTVWRTETVFVPHAA